MATIDTFIYNHPPFQEGNDADWEFTLSSNFPVENITEISLQVRDSSGRLVFPEKLMTTGDITLNGYDVAMQFGGAEMKGKSGTFEYEFDFIGSSGRPFATIKGKFPISREINKR